MALKNERRRWLEEGPASPLLAVAAPLRGDWSALRAPLVGGLVVASFPALVVGASAWTVKPTDGASSWQVRIPSVRVHRALALCVYEQRSSLIMGSLSCHQSRRRGPNWRGGRTRSRKAVGRGRSVVLGTAPEAACPRRTFRSPVSRGAVCS